MLCAVMHMDCIDWAPAKILVGAQNCLSKPLVDLVLFLRNIEQVVLPRPCAKVADDLAIR